ncbi:lipopolysaccharide-induced tumor necrosis factor-alpha factor homolog isoform X2 [Trematomus bernacchii]|uniref:lipopolysaccharide-induced tumor necrosis factor-alpha factor homolog isoform X2 n=1 Tax=Trematomus bernacchii TaxID=40690 RepID=UPI00146ABFEF|nr:lipopolysaccharide-induced tumor necrosis factor-alpha factor homolog isoform X2 [Trematomus bernacchii]
MSQLKSVWTLHQQQLTHISTIDGNTQPSTMSTDGKSPPPYVIPVQDKNNVPVYHLHTPFTPPTHEQQPGMTTCTSCQQQVMTNVTYKAGTYAWLMCLLFICCGLFCLCCLIPFFLKDFKDAYHTCPRCNRVLHIEKKKCCKK